MARPPVPRLLPEGLSRSGKDFVFTFTAMAAPCEVKLETEDPGLALSVGYAVQAEASRIELKYSRYRKDSALSSLNANAGEKVKVDDETANLLDFAAQCYAISDG